MTVRIVARLSALAAALAIAASLVVTPAAAKEQQPSPDQQAADTAARIAAATSPLSMGDFAGAWGRHGFSMNVNADGTATATWRTYDDTPANPKGKAAIQFDHADYRTLSGTVLSSSDRQLLPLGPVQLTEYDYGLGELVNARGLNLTSVDRGFGESVIVAGPRYASAPDWVRRLSPIGA